MCLWVYLLDGREVVIGRDLVVWRLPGLNRPILLIGGCLRQEKKALVL
jgi:hypothetical protein